MKIAVDARALVAKKPAGKEQFTINVLEQLFKLDRDNDFILYSDKDFQVFLPPNFSKKIIKAPSIFWHFFVFLDLVFLKPDLFFAPISYIIPSFNFLSPNIIIIHDLFVFLPIEKKINFKTKVIEKIFLRFALHNCKKIIAVSQNTKQDLIKHFRVLPEKIKVISEAARDIFHPISNQRNIHRVLYRYKLPESFILFVSTLEPRKNMHGLIKAFNMVIGHQVLVVVGKKGWHYKKIFNAVKALRLEHKIFFLDYVPDKDLPYLYNAAICFVYPSLYEGFGLPVLEAMACGCPVITSNISCLPEVVDDAAILVDPYNTDEIANALQKVLTDKNLRQELKQKGLVQAQKFSWEKTAKQVLDILCG